MEREEIEQAKAGIIQSIQKDEPFGARRETLIMQLLTLDDELFLTLVTLGAQNPEVLTEVMR